MPDLSCCTPLFQRDPILYFDLTETVRRGEGRVIHASSAGALVAYTGFSHGGEDTGFTLCAADPSAAQTLCGLLPTRLDFLTVHEPFCLPLLRDRLGFPKSQACRQAVYPSRQPLPLPDCGFQVVRLTAAHLSQIRNHYPFGSTEYLVQRLEAGELYGAFRENNLAGFVGRHTEGTIGLLEVLPQYRRQGVATLLQRFMTNLELSRGHIPYGQVFEDNIPSLALQRSLGYRISDGLLYWVSTNE